MPEDRISRNAGFAFLTKIASAALTAVLTIFLARQLGAGDYGYFTFALGVVTLGTVAADLGVAASAARFLAERRGRHAAVGGVYQTALRLKMAIALVAALILFAVAAPLCHAFGSPGAVWPLRGAAVSMVGESMLLLFIGAFSALGRQRFNLVITVAESLVEVAASVALVLAGAGAAGAAFGRAAGYTVGLAIGLVVTARALDLKGARPEPRIGVQLLRYAGSLVLIDAAFRAFASIDVLLVSALVGGGAPVAAFGLPMRLAAFLDYPVAAVATAVAPRLARREGGAPEIGVFAAALRWLTLFQALLIAPVVVWPEAILHLLFGSGYPEAPAVLRALAPYVFFAGIAQLVTLGVNYLGAAAVRIPVTLAMLAVNALVDVILLPRVGVVGAGIGTSAAYALWVPAHVWILHRRAELPLRPLLLTSVRALAGAAAATGVLVLLGTGDVGIGTLAAGAVLGTLAYALVLALLGELRGADLTMLRRVLARRVRAYPSSSR